MAEKECLKCIHHPVCKTAESCDGYVSGCEHFVVISNLETTTQTNADRIRAMSDEELAKVPAKFGYSCVFPQKECSESDTCENCLLEWLKQPADRGEEDG